MAGATGTARMKSPDSRLSSTVALIATPGCAPSTGEWRRSSSPGAEKPKTRSLASEEQLLTVTLDEAQALFAIPKRGRGRQADAAPLRELGVDPVSAAPVVVKDGQYGPYVTDGTTNASLPKGANVADLTLAEAARLLAERREAGPVKKKRKSVRRPSVRKKK